MDQPRYSVVVPHYDGSVHDDFLLRGLQSLAAQSYQNFEILLYHDGPLSRPLPDLTHFGFGRRLRTRVTEQRHNDWGHSLRDIGIREAQGDYIVHFNPDNVLYPNALRVIEHCSRAPVRPGHSPEMTENPDVLIFAILMRGMSYTGRGSLYRNSNWTDTGLIYTGMPAAVGLIDCLQLVATKTIWEGIGGWYDKSPESDGRIYSSLVATHGARYVPVVLGEHW
jgi:glycosyltransferase involved in cell wall biosynthesis